MSTDANKEVRINIRMTVEERAAFRRWCEARGKEMSEVIRAYARRVTAQAAKGGK